jgi:hypothetical protein
MFNFEKIGILVVNEWCHDRNIHGLQLMCKTKNIPIHYISSFEESKNFESPLILSPSASLQNFPLENIPNNKFVIYGPHGFILPPDNPNWIGNKMNINAVYNVLNKYSVEIIEKYFSLKIPLVTIPFAVDIDTYIPDKAITSRSQKYIFYFKNRSPCEKRYFENNIEPLLKLKGYNKIEYIYGNYNENNLKIDLKDVQFAIIIGRHESQGFALEQIMSNDVPLLVWDVTSLYQEHGTEYFVRNYVNIDLTYSSVPYWDVICGEKFTQESEFIPTLNKFINNLSNYNPRRYICDTLSPVVCLNTVLKVFKDYYK